MKIIALILSLLLLTSCSNPETWDGVTLSRGCGNDSTNVFPYGSCEGPSADAPSSGKTACGWISANGKTHYIMPYANLRFADLYDADLRDVYLSGADLRGADLRGAYLWLADLRDADLSGADLRDAILRGVKTNSRTTCPNGKKRGTRRNGCGF